MNKKSTKTTEKDVIWPIRMKESFKVKFKDFCDKNGYSMNKRVKFLMEKDLENYERDK